ICNLALNQVPILKMVFHLPKSAMRNGKMSAIQFAAWRSFAKREICFQNLRVKHFANASRKSGTSKTHLQTRLATVPCLSPLDFSNGAKLHPIPERTNRFSPR